MTDEKWQNIVSMIKDKFAVEEESSDSVEIGNTKAGSPAIEIKEIIIFDGPLGKIKLERTTRPIVVDKKTQYSQRIGAQVTVDYVYSDSENSQKVRFYRYESDQTDWVEINQNNFNI